MKLVRSGARHFYGYTTIFDVEKCSVRWNDANDTLVLRAKHITDVYNPAAEHDYELILTLDDIREFLEAVGSNAQHPELARVLGASAISLIRMMVAIARPRFGGPDAAAA